MPCQKIIESTPATLKISENARKYHFLPKKSMFGLRKNSTCLGPFSVNCHPEATFLSSPKDPGATREMSRYRHIHRAFGAHPYYPMLSASPRCLRLKIQSKITRETKTAVNKFAKRPKLSVTANPRTGPVPKINRMIAETIVVTCVSTIVIHACRSEERSVGKECR